MGISGFLSSCSLLVRPPLELRWGTQDSSQVTEGESDLLSSSRGELGILLKLWWGTQGSSRVAQGSQGSS